MKHWFFQHVWILIPALFTTRQRNLSHLERKNGYIFLSESWERPEFDLKELIQLEDYQVISNPFQRKGNGGRPALIVNTQYYHVRNLTNTLIQIPWGCEATWALLTPKNTSNASKIQKIALCSVYCKPDSRNKTRLLDHISQAYNIISSVLKCNKL